MKSAVNSETCKSGIRMHDPKVIKMHDQSIVMVMTSKKHIHNSTCDCSWEECARRFKSLTESGINEHVILGEPSHAHLEKQLKIAPSSDDSIEVTNNDKIDNCKVEENIATYFNHNVGVDSNTLRSKENTDNVTKSITS